MLRKSMPTVFKDKKAMKPHYMRYLLRYDCNNLYEPLVEEHGISFSLIYVTIGALIGGKPYMNNLPEINKALSNQSSYFYKLTRGSLAY